MRWAKLLLPLVLLLPATAALAQTGKIAGLITDAETGESLPGVNVALVGITQGAVTDVDGYFTIINVRPGTYDVRASFIGYTPVTTQEVQVYIDLTTEVNFNLQVESVGLDEVVVAATRPVVQRDISASVANISAEEIENLPVTDIEKVIGLQAGFERGLTVRGFGGDQISFNVDGMSTASGRNNNPYTGVSYTSVQEVQVQSGGFNAEYGNVRSGLINVITKDPDANRYTVDAIVRYSPAHQTAFPGYDVDGNEVDMLNSEKTFDLRPLFDPEVAMDGVGAWPAWKQDSYRTWTGWNSIADTYNTNNGTNFTGAQIQQVFKDHYLRRDPEVTDPNYEVDATIGGPVPGVSKMLGDLRFLASYRQTQKAFAFAGNERDAFTENNIQGKLITNPAPGMRLVIQALSGKQKGLNRSENGQDQLVTGDLVSFPWDGGSQSMYTLTGGTDQGRNLGELFNDFAFELMDVDRTMLGAQFTHTLSANTFYEVQLQSTTTTNSERVTTNVRDENDLSFSYLGGQINLDSAPLGYTYKDRQDIFGVGMITAGHWGSGFDNTVVKRFQGKFDITSQLNRFSLAKAGVEYIYSDYDVDYGESDPEHPHNGDPKWRWHRKPQQAAAYVQDKLEFKGMVANIGLRLDYFHAGGDWYVYDQFDRAFTAQFGVDEIDAILPQEPTDHLLALSPRLGVSFPVTDDSKLYFNYGHFRNMLNPSSLFNVQEDFTGAVRNIGNPNHPMPRTVAYELGFEQNLFDQYLLRLAGYYRDLSNQPRNVTFISLDDLVNYGVARPWNYGDVRGFEMTITRNRGRWVRGFINYTYSVRKTGNFGFSQFDQNRTAQRSFVDNTTEHYTSKPIPEPFARFNIEVLIPKDLGPEVGGSHILGDWRINFLGEWRLGQAQTWNGQSLGGATGGTGGAGNRELQGNVRWKDYYGLDMRLSKNFETSVGSAQFFVDFTNVLNLRYLYSSGNRVFQNGNSDQQKYMQSLHLPEDTFPEDFGTPYTLIPGDDQLGDYRKKGVAFVPIIAGALPEAGLDRPLYYVPDEGQYYQWNGSAFTPADGGYVSQVLDDKAYIDMPNQTWSTFLNPRNVSFGLRLNF
jgi:outer membrane receptor protein involved in Fe transport